MNNQVEYNGKTNLQVPIPESKISIYCRNLTMLILLLFSIVSIGILVISSLDEIKLLFCTDTLDVDWIGTVHWPNLTVDYEHFLYNDHITEFFEKIKGPFNFISYVNCTISGTNNCVILRNLKFNLVDDNDYIFKDILIEKCYISECISLLCEYSQSPNVHHIQVIS